METSNGGYYLSLLTNKANQVGFALFSLEKLEDGTITEIDTSVQWLDEAVKLTGQTTLQTYENYIFFMADNQIKVFVIGSSSVISELKSIDGEELDINPFELSDFTVTKFTGGFDLLFMYESKKRGMYSFDLGENLADVDITSGKPELSEWKIMYDEKSNTFRGGRGHNLITAN